MRKLTVALGLIEQDNKYLMQLRSGGPMIGGAGLIGCFGGKVERSENPKTAARREINEETNLKLNTDDLNFLGEVSVVSDHRMETVKVKAYIFEIKLGPEIFVEASEGELVTIEKKNVSKYLNKMTTGTKACFEQFILKGK